MPTTRGPYLDGASFSVKEVRKGYDQHAQSPVYSPSQDERRVDRVDSAYVFRQVDVNVFGS